MRAVIQRVTDAKVNVNNQVIGKIGHGMMVLLGVEDKDDQKDCEYIVDKLVNLRIFEDDNQKMNLSIKDIKGEILLVPQFTLCGDCRRGRRPSFSDSAPPNEANALYLMVKEELKNQGLTVETGQFGADMDVSLTNQGPVTLLLDSSKLF
ncbi:D-aminoacyl-tRNA deacylase [Proteinivorax hydrogeniformans]|uniref:D-aminoacyl-tRNA deacylase n=1 Tax=Proteinivorax hydrogeniformans TaxID=1826727 RepID=A0AAU8HR67_9FIRM